MKKISLCILLILSVTTSFFVVPQSANADMSLLSALVKKEATEYCKGLQLASVEPDSETNNEFDSTEVTASYSASNFRTQTGNTDKGSYVIMSTQPNKNYGYCHIYKLHMEKSNGNSTYSTQVWDPAYGGYRVKSQFKYAWFPASTMDIAIEVMNNTTVLNCSTNYRCTKTAYSETAEQTIQVVIHRGSNWGGYENYDWVIVSSYPKF